MLKKAKSKAFVRTGRQQKQKKKDEESGKEFATANTAKEASFSSSSSSSEEEMTKKKSKRKAKKGKSHRALQLKSLARERIIQARPTRDSERFDGVSAAASVTIILRKCSSRFPTSKASTTSTSSTSCRYRFPACQRRLPIRKSAPKDQRNK